MDSRKFIYGCILLRRTRKFSIHLDVDVVELRAQADASMPAS